MPEVSSFSAVLPNLSASADTASTTKLLYDRKSAAYALSISVRSLDYLIANKKLETVRLGSKIMIGHGTLVKFSRANHPTLTQIPTSTAVQ
jgi:hypothetical protein